VTIEEALAPFRAEVARLRKEAQRATEAGLLVTAEDLTRRADHLDDLFPSD